MIKGEYLATIRWLFADLLPVIRQLFANWSHHSQYSPAICHYSPFINVRWYHHACFNTSKVFRLQSSFTFPTGIPIYRFILYLAGEKKKLSKSWYKLYMLIIFNYNMKLLPPDNAQFSLVHICLVCLLFYLLLYPFRCLFVCLLRWPPNGSEYTEVRILTLLSYFF